MFARSRASHCRRRRRRRRRRVRTTEKNENVHFMVSRRECRIARHMAQVCPSRPIAHEKMKIEEEKRRMCINSAVNVGVRREQSIYRFSLYRLGVHCPTTRISFRAVRSARDGWRARRTQPGKSRHAVRSISAEASTVEKTKSTRSDNQ